MNKEEIEEIETLEIDFKDTDELELALEVSSKKAIYLIDDLIKHLFELQQENQELKQKYENAVADYETTMSELQELRKQLEEWEHHLKCSKEMLDIQGQKGNYDYDEYMLGLYNGMEYIIALFETREPNFISGKDVEFTNNKTQQKEFIEYMNKTIEELECDDVDDEEMKGYLIQRIDTFKEILKKYKSIMGVLDEKK